MNRSLLSVLWVLLMLVGLPFVEAQQSDWPRTLPLEQGMVTIYSLQVDEMNDDIIHFRAALAYRATAGSEPVFGAGWFESRVEIDQASRIVHPTDLKVTDTRFPAGTDDVQSELSAVLAQQSPAWNLDFSLDELQAALKTAEAESMAAQSLNTAPPKIIYRDHPALLISIDGEPVLREIENSPLEAVINTPYPLIFDGRHYYLNAAKDVWYRAGKATGPFQFEGHPPAAIVAMVNASEPDAIEEQAAELVTAANAPEIVVSTEPAELIVTEGPAAFVPLVDDLLVLQNSDDDVFMHVSSQVVYIVLAGRWYQASSLNGPWVYHPADELPAAFANIPQDSDQADSRVYVAGTQEAQEAVLDAQVPQTAAVARGEVDIDVEYDGDPIFQPVDGTDLVYIQNTGSTVLQSDGLYYLVEDGVWYVSTSPDGPWQVSVSRPAQVDTILPTSPVYNSKYVQVYDSTPSVVYVGYTPGYYGSYVYHNTIFYGSGWHYRPWVSPRYYYPRHSTWGWNVSYNSWSGWNFGLSWGWGPFSVGYYSGGYWHHNQYWHHRHYGHWGPRGYRPRHYSRNGYGRRDHGRGGYGRGGDGHRSDYRQRNDNLYRDGRQQARIADTRDNQPRAPGRRAIDARKAKDSFASRGREPDDTGLRGRGRSLAGGSRTGTVRPSDLRAKAKLRDVNFEASRSRLIADNSGNVYRKADREPARNKAGGRNNTSHKTQPTPIASTRKSTKRVTESQARQRSSREVRNSARASQPRTSGNRARSESKNSRSESKNARPTNSSARSVSNNARSVSNNARSVSNNARSASNNARSASNSARSASNSARSASNNARSVSNNARPSGNSARQRPTEAIAAPAQRQNNSRPQRSGKSGSSKSEPAQRAPQRGAQKSSSRNSGSNRGAGKRANGSQSRGSSARRE
jgi:hypothetical protein